MSPRRVYVHLAQALHSQQQQQHQQWQKIFLEPVLQQAVATMLQSLHPAPSHRISLALRHFQSKTGTALLAVLSQAARLQWLLTLCQQQRRCLSRTSQCP